MSIAELSIKRPVTTIMLFLSMVVVGLIAAVRLPLESMPDVSAPFIYVMLPYAGSTPEETERSILRPVEETLSTMTGVKSMQGNATSESAGVFLQFSDWGRDIAIATAEARERIDAIRNELPDDLRRYMVFKWSSSDEAAVSLRLSSKTLDMTREYDRLDRTFKRRIERIPGVAKVEIQGAPQGAPFFFVRGGAGARIRIGRECRTIGPARMRPWRPSSGPRATRHPCPKGWFCT